MKITFPNIDKVIKDVEQVNKRFDFWFKAFCEQLLLIGYDRAVTLYEAALYAGKNDVVVEHPYWYDDNTLILSANGSTITFIEFGTGVWKYGGDIHPLAEQFGFTRGDFGYKLGRLHSWRYAGEEGNLGHRITEGKHAGMIETEGNPPARAMYEASKEMREKILELAKEVITKYGR